MYDASPSASELGSKGKQKPKCTRLSIYLSIVGTVPASWERVTVRAREPTRDRRERLILVGRALNLTGRLIRPRGMSSKLAYEICIRPRCFLRAHVYRDQSTEWKFRFHVSAVDYSDLSVCIDVQSQSECKQDRGARTRSHNAYKSRAVQGRPTSPSASQSHSAVGY